MKVTNCVFVYKISCFPPLTGCQWWETTKHTDTSSAHRTLHTRSSIWITKLRISRYVADWHVTSVEASKQLCAASFIIPAWYVHNIVIIIIIIRRTPELGLYIYYFNTFLPTIQCFNFTVSHPRILHLLVYCQFCTILYCNIFCKVVGSHGVHLFVMHCNRALQYCIDSTMTVENDQNK